MSKPLWGVHLLDPVNDEKLAWLDARCMPGLRLQVVPDAVYRSQDQNTLSAWCVKRGLYHLPTEELVTFLREAFLADIRPEQAIEIGSGHGALGAALGIRCTDNRMQEWQHIRELYQSAGQAPVAYAPHVERIDAAAAVERYQPHTVFAAWVTHRYHYLHHERGGNVFGVDEPALLAAPCVHRYVFIGHETTHRHKEILGRPHRTYHPRGLYSRSPVEGNVVWVWERQP